MPRLKRFRGKAAGNRRPRQSPVGDGSPRALMRTAGARTRAFLATSAVVILVLIGVAGLLAGQITGGLTRSNAQLRGARGAELLLTVGADFPRLTPSTIAHRLAPAVDKKLDLAVQRVRKGGLLTNIVIWDRSGRIAYSSTDSAV